MKYPAILKSKSNSRHQVVLAYKSDLALHIDGGFTGEISRRYDVGNTVNITHEFLDNTCGEVSSPEHAEFIVELAKNAGFDIWRSRYDINPVSFTIDRNELQLFELGLKNLSLNGYKQITIPLPPKQIQTATPEEEFEMTHIMKNAGDNLVLGCEDSKCDEWPCVGDDVTVRIDAHQWDVKYGHNVDGMNGVVRSIFEDGDVTVYAVSVDGVCYCFVRGLLQKPKTPEEELRDELFNCKKPNLDTLQAEDLSEWLIANYEMKKKPK